MEKNEKKFLKKLTVLTKKYGVLITSYDSDRPSLDSLDEYLSAKMISKSSYVEDEGGGFFFGFKCKKCGKSEMPELYEEGKCIDCLLS